MKPQEVLLRVAQPLGDAVSIVDGRGVRVLDASRVRQSIESIVRTAAFAPEPDRGLARWLIRALALEMGAIPASIHDLYLARGQGQVRDDFTVPAMNLRALSFHAARAVFRAARALDAGAFIFEIARSEIGYSDQRPGEYASSILGAAIAEGFQGPVFIQGDHFQVSAKRYVDKPEAEVQAVGDLAKEAIRAGFFNIDIDTSTLVDLSKPSIPEQQRLNFTLCAELTAEIRQLQPPGVTISVGGEIGEVGGKNSTEPELRAFMDGFNDTLRGLKPQAAGLSKISIQTGTSHGGVVLPDGSIAQVKVDFDTLRRLSKLAKEAFGLAGAVQHGASTLPEEAFMRFAEAGACEVHLATNFQNMLYDRLPEPLRHEMYTYLDQNFAGERKSDMTDEQFHYKTRKQAIGPFKKQLWDLDATALAAIESAWENQFRLLFERLNVRGTTAEVQRTVRPAKVMPRLGDYAAELAAGEEAGDLAD
ncbi:MAG: class II fructose-bisphosphate aldolase [Chloroflexota bacterium]